MNLTNLPSHIFMQLNPFGLAQERTILDKISLLRSITMMGAFATASKPHEANKALAMILFAEV